MRSAEDRRAGRETQAWALLWRSQNWLDGLTQYLMGQAMTPARTILFNTRREARKYRDDNFGYIKTRSDLRIEPHGWKMPKVVRVQITVKML